MNISGRSTTHQLLENFHSPSIDAQDAQASIRTIGWKTG